jgi:hypothetical protein
MGSFPRLSEEERTKQIEEIRENERQNLMTLDFDPPLDDIFNDPLMIEYITTAHAHSLEYEIQFFDDVLPEFIQQDENWSFFTEFFHIYGKRYSFGTLRVAGFAGFSSAPSLGPFCRSDILYSMGIAISEWEAEGNKREGNWLNEFMVSPQYETFLADIFDEIEDSTDGKSIESIIKEIRTISIENSLNPLKYVRNHFLHDAQTLVEIKFQAYQQHKQEGDFVLARLDIGAIRNIWWHIKFAQNLGSIQYYKLNQTASFFPNPYIDLAGIFMSALAASIITLYLSKNRINLLSK